MPAFSVKYLDPSGAVRERTLEAADARSAERLLSADGSRVISADPAAPEEARARARRRLKPACLSEFTSLMASLLGSSMTARDAISIVSRIAERPDVVALCEALEAGVVKGMSFSDALADAAPGLSGIYRGMISIGERTGSLGSVFSRLAAYLEDRKKIASAIGGAMIYPAIILAVTIGGMALLSVYAFPKLIVVFGAFSGGASADLRQALGHARAIAYGALGVVLALFGGIAGTIAARRSSRAFGLAFDRLILDAPLVGKAVRSSLMFDFAFAMEAMTQAGIPLDECLAEAGAACSNLSFGRSIISIREEVRKGRSLSDSCSSSGAFSGYVVQWIAVGERTGRVTAVFSQLRAHFQAAQEQRLNRFMKLIEPAVTVLIGAFVLGMVFTFIIPLFSAMGSLF